MDELIKAMSNDDLVALKDKYPDKPSVATLIDGILETRYQEEAQAQAKAKFASGIDKLFAKLPHPDDVSNIYVHWGKVQVFDGEPEEVEVVQADGSKGMETRQPSHEEDAWIVEVNKGIVTKVASGNGKPTTSKRAITVFKRNGIQLDEKGHFASASKACEKLGLTVGGDSATRVLARDGYIVEPYDGTDYTS